MLKNVIEIWKEVIYQMRTLTKQIPNLITLSRLFITGIIFWQIFAGNNYLVLALIIAGGLSDILDGWAAKRLGAGSRFGWLFDHIVDRIYIVPIFYLVYLYLDKQLFNFSVIAEAITILLSILVIKEEVNWPNLQGKISFGFFIAGGCLPLSYPILSNSSIILGNVCITIYLFLRLWSLIKLVKETAGRG